MKTKQWKKVSMIISFLALAAIALSGCSGGSDGAAGARGLQGDPGDQGIPGPAGPAAGTDAALMSAETMAALNPTITIDPTDGFTIASPPKVKFWVKDANGNGIKGLGFTTQSIVADRNGNFAIMPSVSNFNFNLAKLVPGAAGAPSKWVSYLVTTVPTKTAAGVDNPSVPTRPTTDTTGTLVDNGDGSYTYTFYRDITTIKDTVAAATVTAPSVLADLGDLTYDPTLIHRLVIRFTGNARGTGSNTADGVTVTPSVPLQNPKFIFYDFIPLTGNVVAATDTQREITKKEACNSCHSTVPGHNGGRETRNCVMCHNDQIKYGRAKTTSALAAGTYSSSAPPAETTTLKAGTTNVTETITGLRPGTMGVTGTKTVTTSLTAKDPLTGEYTTSTRYTPAAYVIDGETLGDFPIMIHKLHFGNLLNTAAGRWDRNSGKVGPVWRGELLKKTGFGYNLMGYYAFQDMREYPLSVMNCKKCHVGDTAAQLAAAPQANNWKTKPSRVACGSCHDGINWTTGGGETLGLVKSLGTTYAGHMGGPAADDSLCIVCHADASIYHITPTSTPLNPEVPTDRDGKSASIFRYEIKSVTVPAAAPRYATVVFRITEKIGAADAKPVTLNTLATASQGTPGVDGTGSAAFWELNYNHAAGGLITGFGRGPSFLVHWSTTGGVDFDNYGSGNTTIFPGQASSTSRSGGVYLADLVTGTGGTLTGPDADGYYTAVLMKGNARDTTTGAITTVIDQAFPAGAKLCTVQLQSNFRQGNLNLPAGLLSSGFLTIPSPSVFKSVSGEERRSVYTMAKCQACHEAGYGNESDGGGHVTPGDFASCITCHNPMMAGNGLDPTGSSAPGSLNVKTPYGWNFGPLMHSKHAEANKMGNVNECGMCHLTGTYASVPEGAQPTTTLVTYNAAGTVNLDTDLIVSPYASACLSCHTNADAANHAKVNGAVVNEARGTLGTGFTPFVSTESCGTCHGLGKAYDASVVHE